VCLLRPVGQIVAVARLHRDSLSSLLDSVLGAASVGQGVAGGGSSAEKRFSHGAKDVYDSCEGSGNNKEDAKSNQLRDGSCFRR
jgi:hypothetical protein